MICIEKIDFKFEFLNFYILKLYFLILGFRILCIVLVDVIEEFYDEWKYIYYKVSILF